jgi:GNAT superfamily N-acetyltransferase
MEIVREEAGPVTYWFAVLHEKKVGYVGMYRNGQTQAFVSHFQVHKDYQRFGIGTCLLERAVNDVKSEGVTVIHVCAQRLETLARNLYEQAGFVQVSRRIFVAGKPVVMELKL